MAVNWHVSASESGLTLQAFLRKKLTSHYSAKAIKGLLARNYCTLNGTVEHFASTLVGRGDQIALMVNSDSGQPSSKPITRLQPARPPLQMLYSKDGVFAFAKPAGISSESKSLLRDAEELAGCRLQLLHRLDSDTSGVLLFCSESELRSAMVALFRSRHIVKRYLSVVDRIVKQAKGTVESFMERRHSYAGQSLWGSCKGSARDKGVKLWALTHWKVLKRGKNATLLSLTPETGRTHQLRVHLSEMGHPILGDRQYGKSFSADYCAERCMLHAHAVQFLHPFVKRMVVIEAPLPADFLDLLAAVELQ